MHHNIRGTQWQATNAQFFHSNKHCPSKLLTQIHGNLFVLIVLLPNRIINGIRVATSWTRLCKKTPCTHWTLILCKSWVTWFLLGSMSSRFPSFTWISFYENWMAVCNTEQPGSENLVLKIPCELQFAPKVYIIDPNCNKRGRVLIQPVSQQIKSRNYYFNSAKDQCRV